MFRAYLKPTLMLWQTLRRFLDCKGDAISGVAAIEFAIVGPMLGLLLVCTVDLGAGIYRKMQVHNAAQSGAQYAAIKGFSTTGISNAVVGATSLSGVTASPSPIQFCGCSTSSGITSVACGTGCPGGPSAGTYVRVSAQTDYETILPYPLIPNSFTFIGQSTVRIQ